MKNNSICKYVKANSICELYVTGDCQFKECDLFQGREKFLADVNKKPEKGNGYNPNASKPSEKFGPENDVFVALENILNYPESLTNEQALNYIMESYKKYKEQNQTKPKIIFLDVDGVLNNVNTDDMNPSGYTGVSMKLVRNLAKIVERSAAKIVLTSDWKIEWSKNRFEY